MMVMIDRGWKEDRRREKMSGIKFWGTTKIPRVPQKQA